MTTQPNPEPAGERNASRCSACGSERVRLGRAGKSFGACSSLECKDPLRDYEAEESGRKPEPESVAVTPQVNTWENAPQQRPEPSYPSVAQDEEFPPTWERIGALHKRIGQLEELLKVHVKKIRNQKTEINRLGELHAKASAEIEHLKASSPPADELARRIAEALAAEYVLWGGGFFVGKAEQIILASLSANPGQKEKPE